MNKRSIFEKAYCVINIIILFLFGMSFMGFPNKLSVLWLGAVVLIGLVWFRWKLFDIASVLLGLGFASYSFILGKDLISGLVFTAIPVLAYLAGKVWCMKKYSFYTATANAKVQILALTFGTFAIGLLEKYSRFFRFTEECYSGRYWFEFWDGGIRPATYYMFYAMMMLGTAFWAIYIYRQKKLLGSIFLVFSVIELVFFAWVETKTPFLVIAIVLFVEFAIFLWLNRKQKFVKPVLISIGALAVVVIGAVLVVWFGNLFDIQNSSIGQMLTRDGGIFRNVRFTAQRNALMQLFKYPLGGKQMDIAGLKYVHNVWLDIAYTAGPIPFLFVAAYTIFTFIECVKLVRSKTIPQEMKYLMTGIFIALHLDYSVEPALDASLIFWSIGTCVSGMIKGYQCNRGE